MFTGKFNLSQSQSKISKHRIIPSKIITEDNAQNSSCLLNDASSQPVIGLCDICTVKNGGYVLIDFGCELHGGAELCVQSVSDIETENGVGMVRLVFGESVTEALSNLGDDSNARNDHSTRDMTVCTCGLSNMRYGNTGFRFLKIEAVGCTLNIASVKAVLEIRNLEHLGSFECNDERLNKVFNTAAYTVHLCMQDYLWDGIKRDRLVWVGDMHPEVSSICSLFGYDECVEKSLDLMRDSYPAESEWMVSPSYSFWWIRIHLDWYMQNGNLDYINEQKEYMYSLCNRILSLISEDGTLQFDNNYFVEWSSADTEYMEAGFRSCLIIALDAASRIFDIYGDEGMSLSCRKSIDAVKKIIPSYDGNKQVCALSALTGLCDNTEAVRVIANDLIIGLSTFYGYYVLYALSRNGRISDSINIMRDYWGAMLDFGATTFWEDFEIEWTKNAARIDEIVPKGKRDIHADCGRFCYQGLRHSLCHGWSSGPVPFIMREILGIKIVEPGCKKIHISPNLGGLSWAKGTYPTPQGILEVEHRFIDGKVVSNIKAPDGVEIV